MPKSSDARSDTILTLDLPRREQDARTLLAELRSRPPQARPLAVESDPRFARRELAELLISEGRERIFDQPAAAVDLTRLAVAVATRLDPERYGEPRVNDVAARAWGHHANALRVDGDPAAAERAFEEARAHRRRGTGDRLLAVRLLELEASLYKDQQRFPEAHARLDEALAVYRELGLTARVGRALVKRGSILLFEGRYEAALRAVLTAVPMLRPEEDRRTFIVCAHNAINCLNQTGYSIAARGMVDEVRRLHEKLGDDHSLLRLDWMAAEIDLELGLAERAERGLLAVRQGLLARGLAYDAALVSLQLAELYAADRDPLKLQHLAQQMFPIFQARNIHRGALAALILFREAVAMRQADGRLIRDLAVFLREARRNRELRFRPR